MSEKDREKIVEQFLSRVKYYANKYSFALPPGLSVEDLVSAGIVGLLESANRYDSSMNVSISTFVDFRIRGAIIDEIRSMQWSSKDARKRLEEVRAAYSDVEKKFNRQATDEEVAKEMDITIEELYKILSTANTMNMINLDAISVNRDGDSLDILECIASDSDKDIIEELNLKELKVALGKAIDELPKNERMVITLYYYEELTMKEVGKILDISESRVCQLHGKALAKMKTIMKQFNT